MNNNTQKIVMNYSHQGLTGEDILLNKEYLLKNGFTESEINESIKILNRRWDSYLCGSCEEKKCSPNCAIILTYGEKLS